MLYPIFESIVLSPLVTYGLAIVVLLVIIFRAAYEWNEHKIRRRCLKQNIPYVRTPSQMLHITKKQHFNEIESQIVQQNGLLYGCNMMNSLTVSTANPELVQMVCNKEFTKMANRRPFVTSDPVFDNFLFSTNDDQWKRIRAIVSPTFSSGKLRRVKFCIDDTVKTMVQHLETLIANDPIVNVKSTSGAFTMDTIIQMGFGVKIDSLRDPDNKIIKMARKLFSDDISLYDILFFTSAMLSPKLIKHMGLRFQGEVMDYFRECAHEIIVKKRKEMESKTEKSRASNFIELCLEVEQELDETMHNDNGHQQQNGTNGTTNGVGGTEGKPFKYITNDELLAQCITFFTVGYDTTATAITNVCYALAKNPDKQEKLYRSIMKTLETLRAENAAANITDPFELITFDTLNRFEYMTAALDEAMRLYSIVTATERLVSQDMRLETSDKKVRIDLKKGDIMRIVMDRLHHDPDNFSNPLQYIPERFLANNDSGETCNKHAFIPFGSGPRNCLARNLARLEAQMALVHLSRLFRFSICDKTKFDTYINADVSITKDLYLKVETRN